MGSSGYVRTGLATTALVVLCAALPALSAAEEPPPDPPDCTPTELLVNPCRPWLGAAASRYPQAPSGLRQQVEHHEQRIGRRLDVVHAYHAAGVDTLSADEQHFATRPGTLLYLNWKPASRWADAGGGNADVDASIDRHAASIKALGDARIFLTVHHEPENDVVGTVPGCTSTYRGRAGTAEEYRAMWRNVRQRFDAAGVTNVVWAVNYMSYAPYNCMIDDLYPGNDLVDWVVFDNYGSAAQDDFVANVGRMYDFLTASSDAEHDYLSKPWGIGEWNIRKGQLTPQQTYDYYDAARAAVEADRFPNLELYMVWDSITPDGIENRVGYQRGGILDPVRQEHYTALAQSPAFGTSPLVDLSPPTAVVTTPVEGALDVRATAVEAEVWDDVGVTAVTLLVDGAPAGEPVVPDGYRVSLPWDSTALPDGPHSLAVVAADAAGGTTASTPVNVHTLSADLVAPSPPGRPGVTLTGALAVAVSWAAASDDVGVTGYELWRNGVRLADSAATAYTDTSAVQGSTYSYSAHALDAAGNRSSASPTSPSITVPDRTAPTAPTGLTGTTPARRTVRLTWRSASDNVGVTRYQVFRGSTRIATVSGGTLAYTVSGLSRGTTYRFTVRALDAAGNVGPMSSAVFVRAT